MTDAKFTFRQKAAAKLLAIYRGLPESKRSILQTMLLQHTHLYLGTSRYMDWAHSDEHYRRSSYLNLYDYVSEDAASAWFDWAALIEMENLSAEAVKNVLVHFVGEIIHLRYLEAPLPAAKNIKYLECYMAH